MIVRPERALRELGARAGPGAARLLRAVARADGRYEAPTLAVLKDAATAARLRWHRDVYADDEEESSWQLSLEDSDQEPSSEGDRTSEGALGARVARGGWWRAGARGVGRCCGTLVSRLDRSDSVSRGRRPCELHYRSLRRARRLGVWL